MSTHNVKCMPMEDKISERLLLSIKEVAPLLNVKESTLRSWIHQKKLSVVRLGRCVRIKYTDVQKIMDEGIS